jgi:hypothetical protein
LLKQNGRNKYQPSQRLTLPRRTFRTAIGNGSAILNGVDGRSLIARRFKEVGTAIALDLACELDELTEGQRQLIRTACGLVVLRENLDPISNGLRRVLATIGLERKARDVTPSVAEYVKRINSSQEEADA